MTEQDIKDRYTKVCICRAISRYTIKEAVANGARSVEAVKRATGATTGSCKGSRCRGKIVNIIKDFENN